MERILFAVGIATALVFVGCGKAKEEEAPAVIDYRDSVEAPVPVNYEEEEVAPSGFDYDVTEEFVVARLQFTTDDGTLDHDRFHHKISVSENFIAMIEIEGDIVESGVFVRDADGTLFETEFLGATTLDNGIRLILAKVDGSSLLPGLNELEIAVVDQNNNGTGSTFTIYKNN